MLVHLYFIVVNCYRGTFLFESNVDNLLLSLMWKYWNSLCYVFKTHNRSRSWSFCHF